MLTQLQKAGNIVESLELDFVHELGLSKGVELELCYFALSMNRTIPILGLIEVGGIEEERDGNRTEIVLNLLQSYVARRTWH